MGDVERFAREHWGRAPMVRRGADDFRDLLDVDAVERLLVSTARRPTFRLVREGVPLPQERTTAVVRLGGRTLDDVADVGRIADELAAGATLVLQGLQRTWLPVIRFCRALEAETSHPVQANAYLTPAGGAGLGDHADGHDVLVLQVEGSKAWHVDGLGDVTIAAGDVLYIPAGVRHSAAAQSESSLHLTIGLLRITYRDVLVGALPALDEPLPLGYGHRPVELADVLRDALATAADALREVDAGALAAEVAAHGRHRRRPLGLRAVRTALALAAGAVDATSVVRRPHDVRARVEDEDGRVVVHLADRRLRVPARCRPAVDALVSGDAVKVVDLPGLDEEGRVVLARRFAREGAIVVDA